MVNVVHGRHRKGERETVTFVSSIDMLGGGGNASLLPCSNNLAVG